MFDLWMDYTRVRIIKLMFKLKDIPKIIPVWQRGRSGIWLRALKLALRVAAFLRGGPGWAAEAVNSSKGTGVRFTYVFCGVFFCLFRFVLF